MTVDELEALIAKAEKQLGDSVLLNRDERKRTWSLIKDGPSEEDVNRGTLSEVVTKLQEWATPPKPATLTIEVPFSWVEARVKLIYFPLGDTAIVDKVCHEALKPWAQS